MLVLRQHPAHGPWRHPAARSAWVTPSIRTQIASHRLFHVKHHTFQAALRSAALLVGASSPARTRLTAP